MKNKLLILLALILLIIGSIFLYNKCFKPDPIPIPNNTVDSVKKENKIIYDTIDSLVTRIIYIEKTYEKERDSITNLSADSAMEFFSNYISEFTK